MGDFLIFFYLTTAFVWLYRSHRAFEALRENPVVEVKAADSPLRAHGPIGPEADRPDRTPLVSILLPVKNEEVNLELCLNQLLAQDYPSKEIIVINDHSIDRTGEILSQYALLYPNQIRTFEAADTPPGWTGKNWALAQGVPLARGEWFLFTDADTRHEPWSLSSAVAHAEGKDLNLLTLAPRCLTDSFWEKTLQPPAMTFLGLWFPFHKVNQPGSQIHFGNGQYLLMRKKAYQALGGHERVKEAFLEDFSLVREAKKAGFRIECAIGTKIYGTRMYRSFLGIWLGWRRIFFHAFERKPLTLLKKAILVFSFSFLPFFFFPFFTRLALIDPDRYGAFWGASFPILILILLTAWKAHDVVKAERRHAFLHPFAGFVLAGILIDAAWAAWQKKELRWR